MSAWCPRLATKNTTWGVPVASDAKTGVMTVMSGRWEPPAVVGWLVTSTSPWGEGEGVRWGGVVRFDVTWCDVMWCDVVL